MERLSITTTQKEDLFKKIMLILFLYFPDKKRANNKILEQTNQILFPERHKENLPFNVFSVPEPQLNVIATKNNDPVQEMSRLLSKRSTALVKKR